MMIKQKNVAITLAISLVLGFFSPLSAQTGSTLSPGGQSTIDGRIWLTFTGPGGMRILALAPFPEEASQRLERTVSVVSSWPTIRVTELRAESSKGVDDYVLAFSSIVYEGREYSANVPGGLRLRFDGALMYDFRVRSGDYFVRVRGVLMDEASLIMEIAKAVQDPGAYIAERDPSWLALRIEQLDKFNTQLDRRLDQLDSRTIEVNRRLTQKTDETAALLDASTRELQSLVDTRSLEGRAFIETLVQTRTAEGLALVESRTADFRIRMELMAADFESRLELVQNEAAEDRKRLEATFKASLEASQSRSDSVSEGLRVALASEMNKGLFGAPKPLDAGVFDHVMTLKRINPGADRAAALESAKAGGLKPRSKEIDIIFRVWFGQ
jgi:hypothetical protein